jgi:hypothetical protein
LVKAALAGGEELPRLLERLRIATIDDECEFIVAAHDPHPRLIKIWKGVVSGNLQQCAIGDGSAYRSFLDYEARNQVTRDPRMSDEGTFTFCWQTWITDFEANVPAGVGGLPVLQLAHPAGHCYGNYAGTHTWSTIPFGHETEEMRLARARDEASGMLSFSYNVYGAGPRGVAVCGALLTQVSVAYIYTPLDRDFPVRTLTLSDHAELNRLLAERAILDGGVVVD